MSKFSFNLNDREWGEFFITGKQIEILNLKASKSGIDKNKLIFSDKIKDIPYITRTDLNNGYSLFIGKTQQDKYKIDKGNVITIGLDTQTVFYQPYQFFTGQNIQVLSSDKLNKFIALFLVRILSIQLQKFNWGGNGATLGRLARTKIILPITQNGEPDYAFMENFIKERMYQKLKQYNDYLDKQIAQFAFSGSLKEKQWGEFFVKDIFPKIQRGKRLVRENQISGTIPYVSSSALNNGVDNFIQVNISSMRQFENCISLANSGSVGSAFYEPFNFVASDHITHLKNEQFNGFVYLFIANICNRLSQKYNFNREINDKRIKREKILLPVTQNGEPDYAFMENYTRNLMLKKYKKYAQLRLQEYA